LKDVFDTADMPTTGGSLALKGMQPAKDAFTVTRFRQNGALILGKTNMHELV
jgi:Asp-tRNA(Asn)/Glu-tRNA(Gln) amidotransferase A subunit family amidase